MVDLKTEIFGRIKCARELGFITNCYSLDVVNHIHNIWKLGDDFVFSYMDHGILRLIYFVADWRNLDVILDEIDGEKYYLEFLTRNPDEYIPRNSKTMAKMKRLSNTDCRSVFASDSPVLIYKNAVPVQPAEVDDVKRINQILWDAFLPAISHLLNDDEIKQKIKCGHFFVHKNELGQIDALLQEDMLPKKYYINQIVNRAEKEVVHCLLLNRLEEYVNLGGRYLYAWVQDNNIASLKFHGKYGMKHDGMWSMIYSLERKT